MINYYDFTSKEDRYFTEEMFGETFLEIVKKEIGDNLTKKKKRQILKMAGNVARELELFRGNWIDSWTVKETDEELLSEMWLSSGIVHIFEHFCIKLYDSLATELGMESYFEKREREFKKCEVSQSAKTVDCKMDDLPF